MQRQRQLKAKLKAKSDEKEEVCGADANADEGEESMRGEAQLQAVQLAELRKACASWAELIRLLEVRRPLVLLNLLGSGIFT